MIGDALGADRVLMRLAGRPRRGLVPVLGPGVHAPKCFPAPLADWTLTGEEHLQVCLGRVFGVPIAPMTSGAQPCMHAAPWGAEEAGTSRRTIAGRISAICWGDEAADVEAEQICVAELHGGEERDGVARHLLDGVGVVPVEPRTPALSNVTARRSLAASASIKAGPSCRDGRGSAGAGPAAPRLRRRCRSRRSRRRRRHRPAVWKLRISLGHGCSPGPSSGFRTSAARRTRPC